MSANHDPTAHPGLSQQSSFRIYSSALVTPSLPTSALMANVDRLDDYIPPLLSSGLPCALPACAEVPTTECATGVMKNDDENPTVWIADSAVVFDAITLIQFDGFNVVEDGAVLRAPPLSTKLHGRAIHVGVFSCVGSESVCEVAGLGKYVRIDERCVVTALTPIPDGVWIRPGCVVPQDAVLSPFTIYEGRPAACVGRVNAAAHRLMQMELIRARQRQFAS